MRSSVVIFLAAVFPSITAAGPLWDSLTASERQQVLNGERVTHVTDSNAILSATSFVWVKHMSPKADPEGAAAIYWDLDAAESYLSAAGVQSYQVVAPFGLSSKNATVVATIPGLPAVTYATETTVYRTGPKRYSLRWHAPIFDQQPAPGLRQMRGGVDVEDFPGDGGGALFVLSATALLAPEVAADAAYKDATIGYHILLTQVMKARFEQGPSLVQLLKLKAAVFAW